MCTMTWWTDAGPGRYSVFFNRDESKKRSIAEPPAVFEEAETGTRFLVPIDPDAGGTWMFANEYGLVVTLLNWYDRELPDKNGGAFESRGLLVKNLAGNRNVSDLRKALAAIDYEKYRPFHLLAFSPEEISKWSWPGRKTNQQGLIGEPTLLDRGTPEQPVSSSSFETEQVLQARREALLAANPQSADDLEAFQNNFGEPSTAFTPRMNRPDAQTWSRSRVDVSPEIIHFRYVVEQPNHEGDGETLESSLPRFEHRVDATEADSVGGDEAG
ncbi:MAG: hypothetical protein HKN23_18535 [Verrucomicrobiales bacterium]|nr:hypothetical protein [Verrucomicrobiales bacterium]